MPLAVRLLAPVALTEQHRGTGLLGPLYRPVHVEGDVDVAEVTLAILSGEVRCDPAVVVGESLGRDLQPCHATVDVRHGRAEHAVHPERIGHLVLLDRGVFRVRTRPVGYDPAAPQSVGHFVDETFEEDGRLVSLAFLLDHNHYSTTPFFSRVTSTNFSLPRRRDDPLVVRDGAGEFPRHTLASVPWV